MGLPPIQKATDEQADPNSAEHAPPGVTLDALASRLFHRACLVADLLANAGGDILHRGHAVLGGPARVAASSTNRALSCVAEGNDEALDVVPQ